MAVIIKKPSRLAGITVYFVGGNRWSDDISQAQEMTSEEATDIITNAGGPNGGWSGATTETV